MTYVKDLEDKDERMARVSIREELEAIDNYEKRIENCKDIELKKILMHNLGEEKEHTAMLMEWLRKKDKTQDKAFEKYD